MGKRNGSLFSFACFGCIFLSERRQPRRPEATQNSSVVVVLVEIMEVRARGKSSSPHGDFPKELHECGNGLEKGGKFFFEVLAAYEGEYNFLFFLFLRRSPLFARMQLFLHTFRVSNFLASWLSA